MIEEHFDGEFSRISDSKRIIIATVPLDSNITIKNREIEHTLKRFQQSVQPEDLYETKISNIEESDFKTVIKVILKDSNNNNKTIDTIVYLKEQKELWFFANAEISTASYYKIVQQDRLQEENQINTMDLFNSVTFIGEEKKFMNYISVYDILKDLDIIFAEFNKLEYLEKKIAKKIKRHLKKIDLEVVLDYQCFSTQGFVRLNIKQIKEEFFGDRYSVNSKFVFKEKNNDDITKRYEVDDFDIRNNILLLVGKELLEVFKILKRSELLLKQSLRIDALNYPAFISFLNKELVCGTDAFSISMKIPFKDYEYSISSYNVAKVFAEGKLEDALKRTYVNILDCPKYLQESLFSILEEKENVFEEKKETSKSKKMVFKRKK